MMLYKNEIYIYNIKILAHRFDKCKWFLFHMVAIKRRQGCYCLSDNYWFTKI